MQKREFQFENVRTALGEPNAQLRQGIKAALNQLGFREVQDGGHFSRILEAITADTIDFLICDADVPGGDICALIHEVRHQRVGANPFLPVIVTTADPTIDTVRRVIGSGADDLISKPLSMRYLMDRVSVLARGRKQFVITHDYVGPDRRKAARDDDGPSAPTLDVPNSLRTKATGGDESELHRAIGAASSLLNEQKMESHANQLTYLVERVSAFYAGEGDERQLFADLNRIQFVAEDLGRRMQGTSYAHVSDLAETLIDLIHRMRKTPTQPQRVDVEILPKLVMAIGLAFSAEHQTVQASRQIADSLSQFANRRG